jgi:hypothetical protein
MRTAALAILVGCMSCAPHRAGPDITPTQTSVAITTEEGASTPTVRLTRDPYISNDVLVGERLELWRLIPNAFEALGLPLPTVDRNAYSATIQNHVVTRNLNGERLSNFLECGAGMGGAYADSHRVTVNLQSWIEAADSAGRSIVRSRLEASARNPLHGSAGTTHCSSRGRLELLVREELRRLSVEQRLRSIREQGIPSSGET